jgi:hypothetical protein
MPFAASITGKISLPLSKKHGSGGKAHILSYSLLYFYGGGCFFSLTTYRLKHTLLQSHPNIISALFGIGI